MEKQLFVNRLQLFLLLSCCCLAPLVASACNDATCIHGSCNGGDDTCKCDSLWYGEDCNRFICDEGYSGRGPCRNYGTCVKVDNSTFTCECKLGFVGNICQSPEYTTSDLCHTKDRCGIHGTCILDYAGNEMCLCDRGYSGDTCNVEGDLCLSRGCRNGGNCSLTDDDWFTCDCPQGWKPSLQCDEPIIDHCFDNPCVHGECSVPIPVLSGINYNCECEAGYYGVNCTDTVCNVSNPCLNGGECSVLESDLTQSTCSCPPYFTGPHCEIEISPCEWYPCFNGGDCVPGYTLSNGSYVYNATCDCKNVSGYEGSYCNDDIDECVSNPCQNGGNCVNTYGSFSCVCPDGYSGDSCEVDVDECAGSPCLNGVCVDGNNSFTCNCSSGYEGVVCDVAVSSTCKEKGCSSGGNCVFDASLQYSVCQCYKGYSGVYCEDHYQPCLTAGCFTQGTLECLPSSCICKDGYSGSKCDEYEDEDEDVSSGSTTSDGCFGTYTCENGGECVKLQDGGSLCNCLPGWGGSDCSLDINECAQSPCYGRGYCLNHVGGFTCSCFPGYTGPICDVIDCSVNPCVHGECIEDGNKNSCKCRDSFTGTFCNERESPDECPHSNCTLLANDGHCDQHCFNAACDYDGGSDPCYVPSGSNPWVNCSIDYCSTVYNDGLCDEECNTPSCIFDGSDCYWSSSNCSIEMTNRCMKLRDNGVCERDCNSHDCPFDTKDCGNNIYLPGFVVLVVESPPDIVFADIIDQFIVTLSRITHATVDLVSFEEHVMANGDSNNKFWEVHLRIDIQFCERSCPTSVEQVLHAIQAAFRSGSVDGFELVDAFTSPDSDDTTSDSGGVNVTVIGVVVVACVCVVLVLVVMVILGKRVRDNGGIKEVAKKVKVRRTWAIPGGNTPEPSELLRDASYVSDRRSTSIDTTTDSSPNSLRKETMPHITWSRIEVPDGEGVCVIGERGHDERKWSVLHHYAARHTNDIHRLPQDGNINTQGPGGFTPLMIAIVSDEKERSKRKLRPAGPVRSDSSSGSEHSEYEALLTSSSPRIQHMGHPHGLMPLPQHALNFITQQTDLNIVNDQGQTALHIAAKHGRGDYVQQLLRANADPNVQDNGGMTPLHISIGASADGAFEVLLSFPKTNIELKTVSGITPLMLAVKMCSKRMVHMLVDKNAEIAATDSEGRTAVHWAAMVNNVDALKLLVKQGPDNVKDVPNVRGETALFLACREGCIESVQHLLDCFANATLLDGLDRSPLQIAYERQHLDIVELLRHSNQGSMVPAPVYTKGHVSSHNPMFNRGSIKMESGVGVVMPSYPQTTSTSLPVAMSLPSSHFIEGRATTTPHLPPYTHQQVPPTVTSTQATGMTRCTSIEAELERLVSSEMTYLPSVSQEQYLYNHGQTGLDASPGHTSDVSPGISAQGGISPATVDHVSTGFSPGSTTNAEGYPSPQLTSIPSTYPSNSYVSDGAAIKQPIYTSALQPGGQSPLVGQTVSPNPPLVLSQAHPGYSPSTSSENKSPSIMYSFPSPPKEAGDCRYMGTTYNPDSFNYYTPSPEDGSGQVGNEPSPPLQTRLHSHVTSHMTTGGYQQHEGIPLGSHHMYDCVQTQTVVPRRINTHSIESTV